MRVWWGFCGRYARSSVDDHGVPVAVALGERISPESRYRVNVNAVLFGQPKDALVAAQSKIKLVERLLQILAEHLLQTRSGPMLREAALPRPSCRLEVFPTR